MPFANLSGRHRWALIALLLVVMLSVLSATRTASEPSHTAQPAPEAIAAAAPRGGVISHEDRDLGVKFDYPDGWRLVDDSPTEVLILEAGHADDLVLIRKTGLHAEVNATNIADFRTVTDGILGDPKANLDLLDTGRVRIGGLPGVVYLYTFPFKSGRGMQAQYFAFQGRDLYTLVFQTGRAERFAQLAHSFDVVLATFGPTGA